MNNVQRFLKVWWGIFFVALLSAGTVRPQTPVQAVSMPRSKISLNGEWEISVKGEKSWEKVTIPLPMPGKGVYFCRKSFELPINHKNAQILLNIGGINNSFQVKINDQYVATQNHGFTPATLPIRPELLRFGEKNLIELEINTELSNHGIPLKDALFQPDFLRGIFRDMSLEILPPFSISSLQNQVEISENFSRAALTSTVLFKIDPGIKLSFTREPELAADYRLNLAVYIDRDRSNPVFTTQAGLTISDIENEQKQISFVLQKPVLWQLRNPNLYSIDVALNVNNRTVDRFTTKIGLRKIAIRQNKLVLNGAEIPLRGVTLLEDRVHPVNSESVSSVLKTVQSLGFNSVSWFTPPSEKSLSLLDSLGILTILRIPVWNTPADILSETAVIENGVSLLNKIYAMARNHPSVLAVSFGQGFDSSKRESYTFIKSLRSRITETNEFFLTAGFRNYKSIQTDLPLDFLSIDLTGRFPEGLAIWLDRWVVEHPEFPVLFTDVFIPYIPVQTDSGRNSAAQTEQALKLKKCISTIKSHPALGYVMGGLCDWSSNYPTLSNPAAPASRIFPFGLAADDGSPRMAWNLIQNLNSSQQDQFSFQQDDSEDARDNLFLFIGFVVIGIFLYSFRRDHKLRGNFIRILSRPFGFHVELKEGRKISMSPSMVVYFTIIACWSLIFASLFYYLRTNLLFDFFLSQFSPGFTANVLLIKMAWQPALGFPGFFLIISVAAMILSTYIKGLALFTGIHLSYRNGFTFVIWEGTIFIFLLPLALIFNRLLMISILHLPLLMLLIIFFCWYIYRLYIGMNTIFGYPAWLSVLLIVLVPLAVWGILFVILDHKVAFFEHSEYLFNIWKSSF